MLTPERYQAAVALFHAARNEPLEHQSAFVQSACGDDAALRRVVLDMLAQVDAPAHNLDEPLIGSSGGLAAASLSTTRPLTLPCDLAGYRLIDVLGQGGMGTVYLAEQSRPARRVALKLIRNDLATDRAHRRFEYEIEALGRLNHEGIARIYDAGFADVGGVEHPYFAMEHVAGRPLVRYAREARLSIPARLELFAAVCDAVQHAHQRGVIHRDLKPSNILVAEGGATERGGDPLPKVLDFGVARLISADARERADLTSSGEVIGTLAYLSPEQLAGDTSVVDTRADVFALGVTLFELLTGKLPHEASEISVAEYLRTLPEAPPPSLTTLDRQFAGDLETIVHCALRPDPAARYESAAALGADVRRFLRHEPIEARQPTLIYQLVKFAQRRRSLALAGAIAVVGAIVGIGSLFWAWHATDKQRQAAVAAEADAKAARIESEDALAETQRQMKVAQAINDFYANELLIQAEPGHQQDPDLTVRELVRRADDRVGDRFADDPRIRSTLLGALGDIHLGFGDFDRAAQRLQEALTLARDDLGERHAWTIALMQDLAVAHRGLGRFDAALDLAQRAHSASIAALGAGAERTLGIAIDLASIYEARGDIASAAAIYRETSATALKAFGPDDVRVLSSQFGLANIAARNGDLDIAAEMHRDILERRRRARGKHHPFTLASLAALSRVYYEQARYDEVFETELEAYALRREILGDSHPDTRNALNTLGMVALQLGLLDDAERYLRQALDAELLINGSGSAAAATLQSNLALVHIDREEYEAASKLLAASLAAQRRIAAETNGPPPLIPWFNYAGLLVRQERFDDALDEFEQVIAAARENLPPDHYHLGIFLTQYGTCLARLDRATEAAKTLREAVDILTASLGADHERTVIAREALSELNTID